MDFRIVTPEIKRVDDKFIPVDNIDVLNVYIALKNHGLNVETLRNNMKDLIIENRTDDDGDTAYKFLENIILCPDERYKNNITHELLHAATTILDGYGVHVGLMYGDWISGKIIGIGLMEGLTAYLDVKLFEDYTKEKREIEMYVYPLTKTIIKDLLMIIPESYLLNYYMNSDLAGFISDLMRFYDDPAYILEFIRAVDNLYVKFDLPKTLDENNMPDINKNFNFVKTFLAESVYILANRYYEHNMIDKKELRRYKKISLEILHGILEADGVKYAKRNNHEYNKIKKRYVVRKHTGKKTHA